MNEQALAWRQIALISRAFAVGRNPQKFPEDADAMIEALADTPAQAERMRAEREMGSLANSASRRGADRFDFDDAGMAADW